MSAVQPSEESSTSEDASCSPSASQELHALAALCENDAVTFGTLASSLGGGTHAFFALVAAVPFLTPLPLPGLSFAFGIYLALVGIRITADKNPWLPPRWRSRPAPARKLRLVFLAGAKTLRRLEGVVRKRHFLPFSTNRVGGCLIAVGGILLAMPFPPGGNFPPAWAVLFLSLGIVEHDDLCWLLGATILSASVLLFVAMIYFGTDAARAFLGF